jgi:hypothetical protein
VLLRWVDGQTHRMKKFWVSSSYPAVRWIRWVIWVWEFIYEVWGLNLVIMVHILWHLYILPTEASKPTVPTVRLGIVPFSLEKTYGGSSEKPPVDAPYTRP